MATAAAAVENLAEGTASLWVPRGSVPVLEAPPTALEFLRSYVHPSVPVLIRGALAGHPAEEWTLDTLAQRMGDAVVTVDVTPDGLGDAVKQINGAPTFVKPEQRQMTLRSLAEVYAEPETLEGVPYLSAQNDSLRSEFGALSGDYPSALRWAAEAFGTQPDAVNLWIGDGRAVSSCHKDHYENMYTVLRGAKTFTLLPPSDIAFLGEADFPSATHRYNASQGRWEISHDYDTQPEPEPEPEHNQSSQPSTGSRRQTVRWVPVDPAKPRAAAAKHPPFHHTTPITVTVRAGETLYLPALWYHRVASSRRQVTIALNYWHDMHYGGAYLCHNFIRDVAPLLFRAPRPPAGYPPPPSAAVDGDRADPAVGVPGGGSVERDAVVVQQQQRQAALHLAAAAALATGPSGGGRGEGSSGGGGGGGDDEGGLGPLGRATFLPR